MGRRCATVAFVVLTLAVLVAASPLRAGDDEWDALCRSSIPGVLDVLRLISERSYVDAVEAGDALVDQFPAEPDAVKVACLAARHRARHCLGAMEAAEAIRWGERATAYDPSDWQSYEIQGQAFAMTGRLREATGAYRAALDLHQEPRLRMELARLHVENGEPDRAIPLYRQAIVEEGRSSELLGDLGQALWKAGDKAHALAVTEEAQELCSDPEWFRWRLQAWRRETDVAPGFASSDVGDFTVSFERTFEQREMKDRLLPILRRSLRAVEGALWPHEGGAVGVVLYGTDQKFHEAVQMPAWASACYDGRLRIRVGTLEELDEEALEATLRHELVHLLVAQKYRDRGARVPAWMDEGLAMECEGRKVAWFRGLLRPRVARRDWESRTKPFSELEGCFGGFVDGDEASVAYAQALYGVKFLRARFGAKAPEEVLDAMLDRMPADEAIRSVTDLDSAGFRTAWRAWVCEEFHLGGR